MFSSEAFLLIFWLHFLAISIFRSLDLKRLQRYIVPRFLVIISLILTYFTSLIGLFIYWFVRIFFAKKKLILMIKPFDFYFDFVSPYSFLAHKEISKIEKKIQLKLDISLSY